jgi:hypothetical protein
VNVPPLISEPQTSEELRRRVLLLLAAQNGKAAETTPYLAVTSGMKRGDP